MALDDLVAAVAAAVGEFVASTGDLSGLSDAQVIDAVGALPALSDLFDAGLTSVIGEWDSRGLYRLDGSRAAGARLARDTGWSKQTADRVVKRGCRLRRHRLVAEAFRDGDVSTDKVDLLVGAAIPARRHLFGEVEATLVSDAKRLGFDDCKKVVDFWASVADDTLGRDRSKAQHEGRRLTASETTGGAIVFDALLDPIGGAVVVDELERITQRLFEDDWATARTRFGVAACVANLPRTATQRRADALVIMATRSATMPAGGRAPAPLFSVHVDVETGHRICELANGTVIARGLLASWVAQADFERVVFDSPKRVIELGVRTRFFTGGLRRAIELRDRHCTFPGCTVPAKRCDVDHIIEYSQGGLTTQANGRLRCPAHNRQRPGRAGQPPQGP